MRRSVFAAFFCLAVLLGCESPADKPEPPKQATQQARPQPEPVQPSPVLQKATEAKVVELSTDALPFWRTQAVNKPALIILTNEPFLIDIPPELEEKALEMTKSGTPADLNKHGRYYSASPHLLPSQAVRAALKADLFSAVTWVVPVMDEIQKLEGEAVRKSLESSGVLTTEEARQLVEDDSGLHGTLAAKPFRIMPSSALLPLDQPAVLHIDLSFFKALYTNEIKTPIYRLLINTLEKLRATGWPVSMVTISLSTEDDGMVSMGLRFLGDDLAQVFVTPAILDEGPPPSWENRSEIYYLRAMLQTSRAQELSQAFVENNSDKASAHYDRYVSLRVLKEGNKALEELEKAIAIDPGYAYEYLPLSHQATGKNRPDAAVKMLEKAASHYPDNPFFLLSQAEIYLRFGQGHAALPLLTELDKQPWSKIYFPDMPAKLARYREIALQQEKAIPAGNHQPAGDKNEAEALR